MTTTTDYGTWQNHSKYGSPYSSGHGSLNLKTHVLDAFGSHGPDGYDFDAIVTEYDQAIDNALPPRVSLCGNTFLGPYRPDADEFDGYPTGDHGELDIHEIIWSIDLWEIISRHENPDTEEKPMNDNPARAYLAWRCSNDDVHGNDIECVIDGNEVRCEVCGTRYEIVHGEYGIPLPDQDD